MNFHWQNLNDKPGGRQGNPLRHGRAWLRLGKREDWCFNWEWVLLSKSCGAYLQIGSPDDYALNLHLAVPFVLSFYLNLSTPLLWKISQKFRADRELSLSVHSWSLWWNLWTPGMEWSSKTPKWRNGSFDFRDFLLGRPKYSSRELDVVDTVIPMPERSYRCTIRMHEDSWVRSRWSTRRLLRATIKMADGEQIPVPGKGENSWDCGEDATYSLTCCAQTVPEAIGAMVSSCMRTRQRHGGLGYVPEVLRKNV